MKKLFLILLMLIISCENEPYSTHSEAAIFQTKQGKPSKDNFFKGGTFTQSILMDASDYGLVFNNLSEYQQTGLFYSRRETVKDPSDNYSFLEEINSEDYKVQVARGGSGAFLWMDGNVGNANFYLDVNEVGGYSTVHVNNKWIILSQDKGVYSLRNLKTFDTNEEARTYFSSVGWNQSNTIYKDSNGNLKVTQ